MKSKIISLLRETPQIKAKKIAKHLGVPRKEVNSFLYSHEDIFSVDDEFNWSLVENVVQVHLDGGWVDGSSFEKSLMSVGCLFENPCSSVEFTIPRGCKILLEAAARLLALCNQLALSKKWVKIDFSHCTSTLTYLNRMGFFDYLLEGVVVLPDRPAMSAAEIYRGNSDSVVEFGSISPTDPDESIPKQLKNSFVSHAGRKYSSAAFTIISELFGNVRDHSKTPIPGFAALQKYTGRRAHLQTVVSDSGKGIAGTLLPTIKRNYPELYSKYDFNDPKSKVLLVKEVFEHGQITQTGKKGRGLGLKRSQEYAVKYDAIISVRQENFELRLTYRDGELSSFDHTLSMPKISGTHVCFDFFLD
jgi:hypothetical protein